MTVLVGVRCSDGIVIGADSVATTTMGPQQLMRLQSNSKIQIFEQNVIVATTGSVGYSQRLSHHIQLAIKGGVFKNLNTNECVTNISKRMLEDLQKSQAQMHPQFGLGFGSLVAASIEGQPCLIEYATNDFQPEIRKDDLFFVSMGSGQVLAEPFLAFISRVLWKNQMPTLEEGKFGVYWVLDHTIKLAPGGVGGPIKLALLRKDGEGWVAEELPDTQEQAQYISELENHIANFARAPVEQAEPEPLPPIPK